MAERLCSHQPCGCQPEPGADYCGSHCADAPHSLAPGARCKCGHPECRPDNARLYDPAEGASPFEPADVTTGEPVRADADS